MKLSPIAKRDKKDKATSKKFSDDVMFENCDVTVIFAIYDQSMANPEVGFRTHSL